MYINELFYIPVRIPIVKNSVSTFGANVLSMRPNAAITDPAIVTARQPYLLVRPLAIGPGIKY